MINTLKIKYFSAYICENLRPIKFIKNGEMTELAEGARLLSECMPKGVPRVRIPLSPPENLLRQFYF